MRIADLSARGLVALSSRRVRAFHQSRVRQEIAYGREAFDVVNLVQHRHGQNATDTRNTLQTKERVGIVELCVLFEKQIELLNLFVVEVDQIHVETHHSLQTVAFKSVGNPDSVSFVADRLLERGQVLLMVDHLYVSDRGSSAADDYAAFTQQIARVAKFCRINVGRGKIAAAQHGELFRIDAVGLGFASVNGFDIQCVAEQEWQFLCGTKIGEPVPIEGGFAADDEVAFAERC